ncbi:hypothetical protein BDV38DRAFT_18454 [Aspergillus pseudotamarii]|uniref:Uncharacterized protein n=1 Tax=Aspergillus pseudotamarii TaxID=132259 RepID=A0A5N6T2E1_ASPPS|nr:uncharacterized protein BDV38DRAFT_18454 [Aspergillus pseudotamarii]KAE8140463.1 hypothetical protein BDV38DRAFT_18454 [Aspergillus pseudotamarii]
MPLKDYFAKTLKPLLQRVEDKLEQGGNIRKAQQLRRKQQEWRSYQTQLWVHFESYFLNDLAQRLLIQCEAYLQVKHDNLFQQVNESPSVGDTLVTETESLQDDLQDLNRRIWMVEREIQTTLREFQDGPLKRALNARRRSSDWYLSEWLQTECAGVGGCSGRDCGCWMRPRSSKRPNSRGHCTSECKCCEDARGFRLDVYGAPENPMIVEFTLDEADVKGPGSSYTKCLINAYIWGL